MTLRIGNGLVQPPTGNFLGCKLILLSVDIFWAPQQEAMDFGVFVSVQAPSTGEEIVGVFFLERFFNRKRLPKYGVKSGSIKSCTSTDDH